MILTLKAARMFLHVCFNSLMITLYALQHLIQIPEHKMQHCSPNAIMLGFWVNVYLMGIYNFEMIKSLYYHFRMIISMKLCVGSYVNCIISI